MCKYLLFLNVQQYSHTFTQVRTSYIIMIWLARYSVYNSLKWIKVHSCCTNRIGNPNSTNTQIPITLFARKNTHTHINTAHVIPPTDTQTHTLPLARAHTHIVRKPKMHLLEFISISACELAGSLAFDPQNAHIFGLPRGAFARPAKGVASACRGTTQARRTMRARTPANVCYFRAG